MPKRSYLLDNWTLIFVRGILATTMSSIIVNLPQMARLIFSSGNFLDHSVAMGIVMASRTWTAAFSGILFGNLADKKSRKKYLVLVSAVMGVAYVINGFLPIDSNQFGYNMFMVCQICAGFGLGGFFPLLHSFSNDSVPSGERSTFFGSIAAVGQVAMILGLIVSTLVLVSSWWRYWFWVIGGLILLGTVLMVVLIEEPVRASMHGFDADQLQYDFQITKSTFRETMLSPTNKVAFFEGLFTRTAASMTVFLVIPFLQETHGLSAFFTGAMMTLFGLPGVLLGNVLFAKYSDQWGKRDIKNRVKLIIISIFLLVLFFALIFLVPMETLDELAVSGLTSEEVPSLLSIYSFWLIGMLLFGQRFIQGIYDINQPPILQEINLPEAQGIILAWNQFLETIGNGFGPLIGGYILAAYIGDYSYAILVCILISLPGIGFWGYALRHINRDVDRINLLLTDRLEDLKQNPAKGK